MGFQKKTSILWILFVSLVLLSAGVFFISITQAQQPQPPDRLVPVCHNIGLLKNYCTICDLLILLQNILNFIYYGFTWPVAVIMLIYGGFLMIFPGAFGGSGQYEKGKKILTNVVIGILIIFVAWLGVDTMIKLVGGKIAVGQAQAPFGPWNNIDCVAVLPKEPPPPVGQKCGPGVCQPEEICELLPDGTPVCKPKPAGLKGYYCKGGGVCACETANPEQVGTDFISCGENEKIACAGEGQTQCTTEVVLIELKKAVGGGRVKMQAATGDSCSDGSGAKVSPQTTYAELITSQPLTVCKSGCTPASKECAKNPAVTENANLMKGLIAAGIPHSFTVTSLTTGSHALTSLHYSGNAVDIGGLGAVGRFENILNFFKDPENRRRFNVKLVQCEAYNPVQKKVNIYASCLLVPVGEKITHVHVEFNR